MMDEQIDWQHRASMALDSAIASRHLITYIELAAAAQIPPPHRIHKLTMWLEALVAVDHESAKPLRASWWYRTSVEKSQRPGFLPNVMKLAYMMDPPKAKKPKHFIAYY